MEKFEVNQEYIIGFTKAMCNKLSCEIIQEIFKDEDISDSEKLKRVDIVLEIYRRTKDETDIKKIKENIIELEKEVKEKRENGEV